MHKHASLNHATLLQCIKHNESFKVFNTKSQAVVLDAMNVSTFST